MICPYCKHIETKVTDKRESGDTIRRRRECLKCENRFTTYEHIELDVNVIKKDGRTEPYNREKLKQGLVKACEKRPISREDIEKNVNEIEEKLLKQGGEITSKSIGEIVMKTLKKMDKVAYIRFASVYKDFQDVKDFKEIIKEE
ncbi:MAG: transcriptional regulator NrdR [Candidatus Nanoarchaeia archaeon]|nr:transcriptional regulator NrdR [Candidatus Nanoarchaeia archaeon]MDD5587639.1 transcriptional regulator NrdR [Candidatus Nanoarchaeia archaeon]